MRKTMNAKLGRRGSALVMVVALLTLIALMGTAYIATARLDRISSAQHAENTSIEGERERFLDLVSRKLQIAIAKDPTRDVDGPRTDSWLADRLPIGMTSGGVLTPAWRYISSRIDDLVPDSAFESPHQYRPLLPFNYAAMMPKSGLIGGAAALHNRAAAVPTWITIQYDKNHPVEKMRDKVRTFPAFDLRTATTSSYPYPLGPINPAASKILAADADGDGIADALLWRLTPEAIRGVTYYAAIRVVDNAAAINLNTAWSRDFEFDFSSSGAVPGNAGNKGFFTSNVGLRELFVVDLDGSGDIRLNDVNSSYTRFQMRELNEYRFGLDRTATQTNPTQESEFKFFPLATVYPDQTGASPPPARPDVEFLTQNEALFQQLGRRVDGPGDVGFNQGSGRRQRLKSYGEADAAGLAYRFTLIPNDSELSSVKSGLSRAEIQAYEALEGTILEDGVVSAALNYTSETPYGRSKAFDVLPATGVGFWFDALNFELNVAKPGEPFGVLGIRQDAANERRVRPVRPLLTTHNPVSQYTAVKINTKYDWTNDNQIDRGLLYPGMLYTDTLDAKRYTDRYRAGAYRFGDIVRLPSNGLMFVSTRENNSSPPTVAIQNSLKSGWDFDPKVTSGISWEPQPAVSGQTKASVNTGGFRELWLAYFQAMGESNSSGAYRGPFDDNIVQEYQARTQQVVSPDLIESLYKNFSAATAWLFDPFLGNRPSVTEQHPARMFRSPIRDPRTPSAATNLLTPLQTRVLRAALASVNTLDLRDIDNTGDVPDTVTPRTFTLYKIDPAAVDGNPEPEYEVTVYGFERQPFITEVFASSDTTAYGTYENKNGYIAIELHNPYAKPISLNGWILATADRRDLAGRGYQASGTTLTPIHTFGSGDRIEANGYVVMENYTSNQGPDDTAKYRPEGTGTFGGTVSGSIYVPRLGSKDDNCFNRELVLLRPRVSGTSTGINDMVPVDQFDFTGLRLLNGGSNPSKKAEDSDTQAESWYYARRTTSFGFVYPGRYDASPGTRYRQEGTLYTKPYTPSFANPNNVADPVNKGDPWNDQNSTNFPPGSARPFTASLGASNSDATYTNVHTIQLHNDGMPGPLRIVGGTRDTYPYGGFARNGDILQVPYIGAYRIRRIGRGSTSQGRIDFGTPATGTDIVELNSVTMDAAFAEDTQATGTGSEHVGRFCPTNTHYKWAERLFDYVCVWTPANDYLPNIDPYQYPSWSVAATPPLPQPVPSRGQAVADANQMKDDDVGVQGLININTASRKVLSMLPLILAANGSVDVAATEDAARAIALHRDSNTSDLTSIFEVNEVMPTSAFKDKRPVTDPTAVHGDLSPLSGSDGITSNDFEQDYFNLTRISNLITTKSDTFTCYILVQGWREAGTSQPVLDWEERRAFIVDRSAVRPLTGQAIQGELDKLKIIPVPTN